MRVTSRRVWGPICRRRVVPGQHISCDRPGSNPKGRCARVFWTRNSGRSTTIQTALTAASTDVRYAAPWEWA